MPPRAPWLLRVSVAAWQSRRPYLFFLFFFNITFYQIMLTPQAL